MQSMKRNQFGSINRSKESLSKNDNLDSSSRIYQIYNVSNLSNISDILKYKINDKDKNGGISQVTVKKQQKHQANSKNNNVLNQSMKLEK